MDYKKLIQELKKPMLVDGSYLVDHFRQDAATAITYLLARAENAESQVKMFDMANKALKNKIEAAEARAEKAEKQLEALSTVILGKPIMTTGQREVITFCGIQVDEAMDRVVDYPILKEKLEKAKRCIDAIEDALDRGGDNDWAREHIAKWRKQEG